MGIFSRYRVHIGLSLVILILIGGILLIWKNELFKNVNRPTVTSSQPTDSANLQKEIENLKKIIEKPPLLLVAIFGGREADFRVINKISKIAKAILIGFLIKKEIEREKIALKYPRKIIFPIDGVDKKGENFDIGPRTIDIFKKEISKAKTIFWSGPLGKIEEKKFQRGTKEIAKAIIESGALSVIGGGETVEFFNKIGLAKKFSHLSTGGSAMLAFLAGEKLPGIEALK